MPKGYCPVSLAMNRLEEIYDKLLAHYGQLDWWPADTPYEVMTGAVLTQNTSWTNVEKAIKNFGENLTAEYVEAVTLEELCEIIRPCGFFSRKAGYLKSLTSWYKRYDYSVSKVKERTLEEIRRELLAIKGVGAETADSILLYAFSYPSFVVDAYTKRLLYRLNIDVDLDYDVIKAYFENALPPDAGLYNNYHALIVINAKEHCKKTPICEGCPLCGVCKGQNI